MTDTVHVRVGTLGSNYYTTACGLNTYDVYVTNYSSKHLVTCEKCIDVFAKNKKKKPSC